MPSSKPQPCEEKDIKKYLTEWATQKNTKKASLKFIDCCYSTHYMRLRNLVPLLVKRFDMPKDKIDTLARESFRLAVSALGNYIEKEKYVENQKETYTILKGFFRISLLRTLESQDFNVKVVSLDFADSVVPLQKEPDFFTDEAAGHSGYSGDISNIDLLKEAYNLSKDWLAKALMALNENERKLILAIVVDNKSYKELVDEKVIENQSSARVIKAKALKKLKDEYLKYAGKTIST